MKTTLEETCYKNCSAYNEHAKGGARYEYTLPELESLINEVISQRAGEPVPEVEYSINTMSPKIHKAVDAFWQYWREVGEPHKHGYYESTWGAINHAIRYAGVVEHKYTKDKIEVKGTTYLSDIHAPYHADPSVIDYVKLLHAKLGEMYDKHESGIECYEANGEGNYIGNAVYLMGNENAEIVNLLATPPDSIKHLLT